MGIDGHLEVAKEAGRILNLINDDGGTECAKAPRLLFRLLGFGRKIKGDECVIRKQVPEGRGLAGLSGPVKTITGRVFADRFR